jgi:hypothetical protein
MCRGGRNPSPTRRSRLALPLRPRCGGFRAGHIGGAERGSERLALLGIHQDRERLAIGFLAQMPSGGPGELSRVSG